MRRYREWLPPGTTKKKAVEYLHKVRESDRLGVLLWPEEQRIQSQTYWTLDDFVPDYLKHIEAHNKPSTVKRKAQSLRILRNWFADVPLREIDSSKVANFQTERLSEGVKKATVNRDFDTLWHLLRIAYEQGILNQMPRWRSQRLKETDSARLRYLLPGEATSMFAWANSLDILWKVYPIFMIYTGLRYEESVQLQWSDIDTYNNIVLVRHHTKSSKQREVPLLPEVVHFLSLLPRLSRSVFCWQADKQKSRYHKGKGSFIKTLPMGGELGSTSRGRQYPWDVPDLLSNGLRINPHMFRHTFAAWHIRAGKPMYQIMQWLGHSTIDITIKSYSHIQTASFDLTREHSLFRPFWDTEGQVVIDPFSL
jgi:integrase